MPDTTDRLRPAAILITCLDRETADRLLAQLTPDQAERVRQAAGHLGSVSAAERERVLRAFLEVPAVSPVVSADGIEVDASLAAKIADGTDPPAEPDRVREPVPLRFAFLQDAGAEMLAQRFAQEHPQTVSLVLAHLPPPRAADVLARLPGAIQAEVLRRLARLEAADEEVVGEVERQLQQTWQPPAEPPWRRPAGLAALEAILAASAPEERPRWLQSLADADPSLPMQLGYPQPAAAESPAAAVALPRWLADDAPRACFGEQETGPLDGRAVPPAAIGSEIDRLPVGRLFRTTGDGPEGPSDTPAAKAWLADEPTRLTFADLVALDDDALAQVFQTAGPQITLLALSGAGPDLAARIRRGLPAREAKRLHRQMTRLGPLRLRDVEAAQQQLTQTAQQLVHDGVIPPPLVPATGAACGDWQATFIGGRTIES